MPFLTRKATAAGAPCPLPLAVNKPSARHPRQPRIVGEETVLQGAITVAGAGMHDEPGGLVDDEEIVVLVHDPQGHCLRRDGGDRRHLALERHLLPAQHPIARAGWPAVDRHAAALDPALDARAGVLRQEPSERLVEAQACDARVEREIVPAELCGH